MEGRMTVCNMSIEAGARAGLVAPDDTTFAYLEGRPHAPTGKAWERALDDWLALASDADATFDRSLDLDAAGIVPHVSWGNYPFSAGDVDGDGRAEIAIKSPGAMPLGGSPLFFELLSGRDGTVLWGP